MPEAPGPHVVSNSTCFPTLVFGYTSGCRAGKLTAYNRKGNVCGLALLAADLEFRAGTSMTSSQMVWFALYSFKTGGVPHARRTGESA